MIGFLCVCTYGWKIQWFVALCTCEYFQEQKVLLELLFGFTKNNLGVETGSCLTFLALRLRGSMRGPCNLQIGVP